MSTKRSPDLPNEEAILSELVREAGDPRIERSSAQIASIEQAILAKLQPLRLPEKKRSRSNRSTRAKQLLALAAAVFVCIWLGRAWTDFGVRQAWAQVAETIRGKPWIHCVCQGPENTALEIWLSPAQKVAALSVPGLAVSFSDFREGVLREYNPAEKVISLRPIDQLGSAEFRLVADVFETISDGRDLAQLKRAEVVEQARREVTEENKVLTEFEFTLRRRPGQGSTTRLVFRIDPASRLPQSLSVSQTSEPSAAQANAPPANQPPMAIKRFALDYPATGPADIYALGVPKDARIVDCGATADVQQLVNAIEAGRPKFDHYVAIVVPNFPVEHWWECWNGFYRVYRKGDRWRVEQCFPYSTDAPAKRRKAGGPADDVDHAQWWLAEAEKRFFNPLQVCDGEAVYRFSHDFAHGKDDGHGDLQLPLKAPPEAKPASSIALSSWGNVIPDVIGRPLLGIPSPHFAVRIDQHPATGPPGTVLLEVESIKTLIHGHMPDLGTRRYWIDPLRNYLVVRWEQSSFKEPRESPAVADEIVKIGVTPQGQYYPLEVRIENTVSPGNDQLFHFYIDFDVEVADELFDPKS